MSDKQEEADFYMDQFMGDFPGESLNLGVDVMDPEKVIAKVKKIYADKGKDLKPFG